MDRLKNKLDHLKNKLDWFRNKLDRFENELDSNYTYNTYNTYKNYELYLYAHKKKQIPATQFHWDRLFIPPSLEKLQIEFESFCNDSSL